MEINSKGMSSSKQSKSNLIQLLQSTTQKCKALSAVDICVTAGKHCFFYFVVKVLFSAACRCGIDQDVVEGKYCMCNTEGKIISYMTVGKYLVLNVSAIIMKQCKCSSFSKRALKAEVIHTVLMCEASETASCTEIQGKVNHLHLNNGIYYNEFSRPNIYVRIGTNTWYFIFMRRD